MPLIQQPAIKPADPKTKNQHPASNAHTGQPALHVVVDNQEPTLWYKDALFLTIVSIFVPLLISFLFRKKIGFFHSLLTLIDFEKQDITDHARFYLPNEAVLHDRFDAVVADYDYTNFSLRDFLLQRLDHSLNFVIAPTGVGKTTFALNLGHQYDRFFKRASKAPIVICKANSPRTFKYLTSVSETEAAKIILVLDALDEFYISDPENTMDHKDFWQAFDAAWKPLFEKIKHFGKVIVTVRDQFFDDRKLAEYHSIDRSGGRGYNIHLLPFEKTEKRDAFIEKRFAGTNKVAQLKEFMRNGLVYQEEALSQPLILNYLEDIYDESGGRFSESLDLYAIYQSVTKRWIMRESKEKRLSNPNFERDLRRFTQQLAFHIANNGHEEKVSRNDLSNFEQFRNALTTFDGLSDRSLLKRINTGKQRSYQFTHRSFFEFFLLQFVEQQSANERKVKLVNYPFLVRALVNKRWRESDKSAIRFPPTPVLPVPLEIGYTKLSAWKTLMSGITINEDLLSALTEFRHTFYLKKLIANEPNIWPVNAKYGILNTAIGSNGITDDRQPLRYARLYTADIYQIDFRNIKLQEEDLDHFDGCKNLRKLDLYQTGIKGAGLQNFSGARDLEELNLSYNDITDKHLKPFRGLEKLRMLMLRETKITGAGLEFLADSIDTLTMLNISVNTFHGFEHFKIFEHARHIGHLDLSMLRLTAAALGKFKNTVPELKKLYVCGNNLTDEMLVQFSAVRDLEVLDICHNQLTKTGLSYFSHVARQLTKLSVEHNHITTDGFAIFAGNQVLRYLNFSGNPVDESVWTHFESCKLSLEEIECADTAATGQILIGFLLDCPRLKTVKLPKEFYFENLGELTVLSSRQVQLIPLD